MTGTIVERIGGATLRQLEYVGGLVMQMKNSLAAMGKALPLVGNRYRWRSSVRQMLEIGVDAAPMVGIMAVCAGFILAMQGASELKRFGAMQFVVDLVSIGFTRELGPLLTAIAVSGRSGSAFSAEIGSMVVTEEIDALRTMAIDPIEFVLAPKFLAALIMLPCLTIVSCACGILCRRPIHALEHRYGAERLLLVRDPRRDIARCHVGADQECGVCRHHRACGVHGRLPGTGRPGCRRPVRYSRRRQIDVSWSSSRMSDSRRCST